MKKYNNYFKGKKAEEMMDLSLDDYAEMFEISFSDTEISNMLGVEGKYVSGLREEYQRDY